MSSINGLRGGAASRRQRMLDGFAVTASVLCLIHCLLLPMLLVALPVLAAMLEVPESFHAAAFIVAVPTSALALLSGYRRHRAVHPAIVAFAGLALLGTGAFAVESENLERAISSIGAVLLAIGHVWNWRTLSHRAATCPAKDAG